LSGAIIGAVVSIFIYNKSIKKNLQLEIEKINLQKEAELSIRLFDKKEIYFAELLTALSTARNAAIDIVELGLTLETENCLQQSKDVVGNYLNTYEKRNILYVPQGVRHEAAQILQAWRFFCSEMNSSKNKYSANYTAQCEMYIRKIEILVEHIKYEIGRR